MRLQSIYITFNNIMKIRKLTNPIDICSMSTLQNSRSHNLSTTIGLKNRLTSVIFKFNKPF